MGLVFVLVALIMLVGLVGVVVPVLPGLPLVWLGVAVWALAERSAEAWIALAIATVVLVGGMVLQYLLPGRRMAERGVPGSTILLGGVLGVIGFFVVPVVGLFLGFVAGVFLAELARLGSADRAWPSTKHALAAVGWSILIEFLAALLIIATWVATLLLT